MSGRIGSTGNKRPLTGWWTYRFGMTVVVFGYGIALGPNRTKGDRNEWQRDWWPVKIFRNRAFRGLIHG